MGVLIFVISWFVIGFICMFSLWISEMRGREFDEAFFDEDVVSVSIMMLILGFISPFLICIAYTKEKKYFTRFIYKIANIGVKKEKISKEE